MGEFKPYQFTISEVGYSRQIQFRDTAEAQAQALQLAQQFGYPVLYVNTTDPGDGGEVVPR